MAAPPSLQFSAATYGAGENTGTATITVTRTGGTSGVAAVNYATANGTAVISILKKCCSTCMLSDDTVPTPADA